METKFKFVVTKCCSTCKHYEYSENWLNGPHMCMREHKEHKIAFPVRLHYCCTGYEEDEQSAKWLKEMYADRQAELEIERREKGVK